jgi:hypothetical protein
LTAAHARRVIAVDGLDRPVDRMTTGTRGERTRPEAGADSQQEEHQMVRSPFRRAGSALLLVAVSMLTLQLGCGDSGTEPSDAVTFDEYWIHGYYAYTPEGRLRDSFAPCVVEVRAGSEDAAPVSGLDVMCGGETLTYDQGQYSADVTGIAPGQDVTFQVSDGRSTVSATLEVPEAPFDLEVVEGAWDFSDPMGSHTLNWGNPAAVADTILFALAGTAMHPPQVASYTALLAPETTSITISNADLDGFSTWMDIICGVFQANSGHFTGHSGESLLWARAAVVEEW